MMMRRRIDSSVGKRERNLLFGARREEEHTLQLIGAAPQATTVAATTAAAVVAPITDDFSITCLFTRFSSSSSFFALKTARGEGGEEKGSIRGTDGQRRKLQPRRFLLLLFFHVNKRQRETARENWDIGKKRDHVSLSIPDTIITHSEDLNGFFPGEISVKN